MRLRHASRSGIDGRFRRKCGARDLEGAQKQDTLGALMASSHAPKNTAILLLSCPDQKGLVATIADFVFRHNGNILHADEHADEESNLFLMRVEFDPADFDIPLTDFARHFNPIAQRFHITWRLAQSAPRQKLAILVSK